MAVGDRNLTKVFLCRECVKRPVSEMYERAPGSHHQPWLYLKGKSREEGFCKGFIESPVTLSVHLSLSCQRICFAALLAGAATFLQPVYRPQQAAQIWRQPGEEKILVLVEARAAELGGAGVFSYYSGVGGGRVREVGGES